MSPTPLAHGSECRQEGAFTVHGDRCLVTVQMDTLLILEAEASREAGLDAAWREAEAVINDQGWLDVWRRHRDYEDPPEERFYAAMFSYEPGEDPTACGPTPEAAVRALIETLRLAASPTPDTEKPGA